MKNNMKEGDNITFFPDFNTTGVVYHVAPITDLANILNNGIRYDDKSTYRTMYLDFHKYISAQKPNNIPDWVIREKAIFASLNYRNNHSWHSHSVILELRIDKDKCWVANENLVNMIYEPFVLRDVDSFEIANQYLDTKGRNVIKEYWDTSLSFNENLAVRRDKERDYDAEIMIFHDIKPKDIKILRIISDHKIMTVEKCLELYMGGLNDENRETT